ncbi:MAG: DUF4282 domain-containing protein [Chloroflexota bacterium]
MGDFFAFRRMVTTMVIQIVFFIAFIATILAGISLIVYGIAGMNDTSIEINGIIDVDDQGTLIDAIWGILLLIGGPLLVRIACEVLILFFRMNETLTDIHYQLQAPGAPGAVIAHPAGGEAEISELRADMVERLAEIRTDMTEELASLNREIHEQARESRRDDS